jgi:hypothetical protein
MAEDESTQETQDIPAVVETAETQPPPAQSPMDAHAAAESEGDPLPIVGAAFAGGFVLAKILKRLGGGD